MQHTVVYINLNGGTMHGEALEQNVVAAAVTCRVVMMVMLE